MEDIHPQTGKFMKKCFTYEEDGCVQLYNPNKNELVEDITFLEKRQFDVNRRKNSVYPACPEPSAISVVLLLALSKMGYHIEYNHVVAREVSSC
jgi:hypothetical protein